MSEIRNLSIGVVAPYVTECMGQSRSNPHILDDYIKYGTISDDPCWKCFLKCIGFKSKILSSNGDVDVQRWADTFNIDVSAAKKCSNFEEPDLCQKSYLLLKYIYDELAKHFPP